MKKDKRKFDNIIMNPPYQYGAHMNHFNNAFGLLKDGGKMACIHPSTPFINRKPTKEDGKTERIKEIVSKYKSELRFVDGNNIFNAGFFVPLSITTIEKTEDVDIRVIFDYVDGIDEVKLYNDFDNLFIHGDDLVLSIRNKIFSKMDKSLEDMNARCSKSGSFYLDINGIAGHPPKDGKHNPDFFCLIYRDGEDEFDNKVSKSFRGGDQNAIIFDSKEEAYNGFEYLKTKFARFCISLYKLNVQLKRQELKSIPYMDFTQEWTDEKLKEHFGITDEEWKFIDEYIGDWYDSDFNE